MQRLKSLRVGGIVLVLAAFILGMISATLWVTSNSRWDAHLDRASFTGAVLYDSLQSGGASPLGVQMTDLTSADAVFADNGQFELISGVRRPSLVTNLSIRSDAPAGRDAETLSLAILSPDLRYPLASVSSHPDQSHSETMGALSRILATYCSDPLMIAKAGDAPWVRIDAPNLWQCSSAPKDYRLLAVGIALVSVGILVTFVLNSSAQFLSFAQMLRDRHRIGGPASYDTEGLQELRDIVSAVNGYLAIERDKLAERAAVLSGVSHDLGTPATRLRLRTALISDSELRTKLEADIDSMTGIIESVLTYTRAELDAEAPRRISLISLIDSVVSDYQDVGSPVAFQATEKLSVLGGSSLFMSRRGAGSLPPDDKVIVMARPVALARALSNLIDNAIKYGRRARVGLLRDADNVVITVEDEGTNLTAGDIEDLMAPFKRGSNTKTVDGYGLGLTIVSTIANMHGGTLSFEPGTKGLVAKITIARH